MPSKIRGGTKDKHLADMHIPRVSALGAGGGAAAAFDPSSVAGYSRDWNFADITKLYTDTAGTIAVTADADPIGAVLCSAGSTVKLAAAADAKRATYKTNIQNGLSVARFDGSDDYLGHATAITADESQTIFIVTRKRTAASADSKELFYMGGNTEFFTDTDRGPGYVFYNPFTSIGGTVTNWNIVCVQFASAASAKGFVNGGAGVAFDPHDSYLAVTALFLGANNVGTIPGDYDIGRALVFSAALSNANLDIVFAGLGALWGISVTAVS